ncbi:MAG: hypothetical protein AB1638_06260 [Nitrospirota bacterium]
MDFWEVINSILSLFRENLLITVVIAILLIFLLYRRPKLFFSILIITLIMAGVFYLISNLSSTAVSQKQKLLQKQDQQFQELR